MNTPGRTVYNKDPLDQAEDDFYVLKEFCGGLTDRIEQERDADIRDIQASIDAIENDINGLKAATDKAYKDMLRGCRRECIRMAMEKDGICSLTPIQIAESTSKEDLNDGLLGLAVWFNGQTTYTQAIEKNQAVDPTKVCSKMLLKPECLAEVNKSGVPDCENSIAWLAAKKELDDANKQLAELKAKQSAYAKNSTSTSCTVASARDAAKPHWNTCST